MVLLQIRLHTAAIGNFHSSNWTVSFLSSVLSLTGTFRKNNRPLRLISESLMVWPPMASQPPPLSFAHTFPCSSPTKLLTALRHGRLSQMHPAHLLPSPRSTAAPFSIRLLLSPSSGQTGTSAVSPPPGVPGTWPAWSGLGPPAPHRDSPTEALMEARTPAACPGRSELTCLQRGPLFYGHHEGVSEDHSSGHTWPGA